jgi:tetratricopeptide (TPR) repeat protein
MFGREKDPLKQRQAKLTSEGNYYGERGNLKRAIKCFEKALSVDAGWVPAYLGLAVAYRSQGKFQQALEALERAPGENYQVAFTKVSVVAVWNAQKGRMGETVDGTALISAIEEALRIGRTPISEEESLAAEAMGVNLAEERKETMEGLQQTLREIQE